MDIGTLTLYREKSVVYRAEGLGDDDEDARDTPVLELRSNRITIPVKTKMATVNVVVRGQNIPGTMRMAAVVVDEIRRDPAALQDPTDVDWETFWRRKLSKYENDYMREAWVSVHVGGVTAFMSEEGHEVIAEVETLANGADVTEALVLEAAANVLGALEDLVVEHDSQTAFVFSLIPNIPARRHPGAPRPQRPRVLCHRGLSPHPAAAHPPRRRDRLRRRHGRDPDPQVVHRPGTGHDRQQSAGRDQHHTRADPGHAQSSQRADHPDREL